jgi:predicted dehydrogenase
VHNLVGRASQFDTWRFEDEATPLVYSGCHFVDLLRWLLDDEAVEVMGMANHLAFSHYRRATAMLFCSASGPGQLAKSLLRLVAQTAGSCGSDIGKRGLYR